MRRVSAEAEVAALVSASGARRITDLLRAGAKRLILAAVQAEFDERLAAFDGERLSDGRRRVVRKGRLAGRSILTVIGAAGV